MNLKILIPALSAALLSIAPSPALGQLHDTGRALVASNSLKLNADTPRCAPFVTKEFIVPYAGVVRVHWYVRSDGNSNHAASSSAQSTIHTCAGAATTSGTFQPRLCDLRVAGGDSVRVTAAGTYDVNISNTSTVCLRTVRVFYNVINATGVGRVIHD